MKRIRTIALSVSCLMTLAAVGSADAGGYFDVYNPLATPGSLPAVSQLNGKVSVFGGNQEGSGQSGGMFGVVGSLSVPMGFAYGLQIDGAAGSGDGAAFYGIGGHLFWRDPARGLIGLYTSYLNWDVTSGATSGFDIGKFGVEGAAYLGRFSLEGLAAYQFGSASGFNGKAVIAYYPIDNLRLDAGIRHVEGPGTMGLVDVEWRPHENSGLSLFASGAFGENSFSQVLGGARYYFGDSRKSLIDRHRQDDPAPDFGGDLSIGSSCLSPNVMLNGVCSAPVVTHHQVEK